MLNGGFGEYVTRTCLDHGWNVPVQCFGVTDTYIQHGDHEHLIADAGLDSETLAEAIRKSVKGEGIGG